MIKCIYKVKNIGSSIHSGINKKVKCVKICHQRLADKTVHKNQKARKDKQVVDILCAVFKKAEL